MVKFTQTPSSLNGHVEASPSKSGASIVSDPQRTTFPTDRPNFSLRTFLYYASRYRLGSASLLRWLILFLAAASAVFALGWLPGWWLPARWWVASFAVSLLIALIGLFRYWQRRDFVQFVAGQSPVVPPSVLSPQEKIPVMVTGFFSVEQKSQRFTWLPGFYRTFATREHALLCQVDQRSWMALAQWPAEEVGLWYIFFFPSEIEAVVWGELLFDPEPRPAIAITRRVTIPRKGRFRPDQVRNEVVYLVFTSKADGEAIWADLHHEFPQNVIQTA